MEQQKRDLHLGGWRPYKQKLYSMVVRFLTRASPTLTLCCSFCADFRGLCSPGLALCLQLCLCSLLFACAAFFLWNAQSGLIYPTTVKLSIKPNWDAIIWMLNGPKDPFTKRSMINEYVFQAIKYDLIKASRRHIQGLVPLKVLNVTQIYWN